MVVRLEQVGRGEVNQYFGPLVEVLHAEHRKEGCIILVVELEALSYQGQSTPNRQLFLLICLRLLSFRAGHQRALVVTSWFSRGVCYHREVFILFVAHLVLCHSSSCLLLSILSADDAIYLLKIYFLKLQKLSKQ